MAITDTDLIPVGRGAATFKATFKDFRDSIPHAADATTSTKGVVQLASAAAVTAGTANVVVDAAQLKVVNTAATAAQTTANNCLPKAGGNMTGSVTATERTITGAMDLATGNFWTCGAIAIPNPTNAVAGMSGLIRLTAAPTSWAGNFKHAGGAAPTIAAFPAIVPFFVSGASTILCGKPVEGMA